ncbi:MAG: sulfatase-like hydrolase/transferase, partial [Chloroflexota bacterium]|nr:sulfatase-like hydrolase/transferase [Chloroflexota bacterium]
MNILVLMGDQHRWDALGCAAEGLEPWQRTWLMDGPGGAPLARTPHLDRLAATGVRFSQAVANLPVCVPCRHSFITGMYPHQIGILSNAHYWPFDPPVPTLGQRLKDAGYATAAVGKMHWKNRSAPDEHVPDKRGFDFRAGRGGITDGPLDVSLSDGVQSGEARRRADQTARFGVGGESREGYVGDVSSQPASELPETWLVDQAVDYLRRHHRAQQAQPAPGALRGEQAPGASAGPQDAGGGAVDAQPFCLLVSLDRPHPPNVIPSDFAGLVRPEDVPLPPAVPPGFHEDDPHVRRQIEQRGWGQMDEPELRTSIARYLINVSYVDDCLGKVLTALDELGYAENTLVVLLSDHGELLGERRQPGHGGAHTKYSLYDSAVRVPLIVRWPGVSRPGVVSHAAVELIDLMPTWLDAARAAAPPYLPGRSLRPLLEGQTPQQAGWRQATLSEQFTAAIDTLIETPTEAPGNSGLPDGAAPTPRGQWAVREQRYKLIHRAGARSAFYDLQQDPGELENLIDDSSLATIRERLYAHLAQGVISRAEQFPAQWQPVV